MLFRSAAFSTNLARRFLLWRAGAGFQFLVLKVEGVFANREAEVELLVGHGQSLAKCQALVHRDLHLPKGRSLHRCKDYLVSLILLALLTGQRHIRKVASSFRFYSYISSSLDPGHLAYQIWGLWVSKTYGCKGYFSLCNRD